MTEQQPRHEQLYRRKQLYHAVQEAVKQEGFRSITVQDVEDIHHKLHQNSASFDQIGQAIRRHLLRHLPDGEEAL